MFHSMRGKTKLCNYVCAALALILLLMQLFVPFWSYVTNEGKAATVSIAEFVWLNPKESGLINIFVKEFGPDMFVNSIIQSQCPRLPANKVASLAAVLVVVVSSVAIMLLSVFSVIFCIKKARNGVIAVVPALAALVGILTFALNPVYRLGSSWVIQLVVCVVLLAVSIATYIIGAKANEQEKSGHSSKADVAAKVSAIKHMVFDLKALKGDRTLAEVNFNRLLAFLTDESVECRIAAVEMLSSADKEVAYTHIVHLLDSEEDESVKAAMREALVSIKKNMAQ